MSARAWRRRRIKRYLPTRTRYVQEHADAPTRELALILYGGWLEERIWERRVNSARRRRLERLQRRGATSTIPCVGCRHTLRIATSPESSGLRWGHLAADPLRDMRAATMGTL